MISIWPKVPTEQLLITTPLTPADTVEWITGLHSDVRRMLPEELMALVIRIE